PGGICISATVYEQVRNSFTESYEDLGEQSLKNIAHPVRVYRMGPGTDGNTTESARYTVPGFGGRPAIAVLPFDNLSGDSEQEYFADGIVEDLITRLSTWRLFPVIARNSTFVYKGKSTDVKKVSRELGVRYVVEGSVRRAGDRVRITAQLIDATTGHHVWAERYDRELRDIFALQDEITQTIVAALEPALDKVERRRAVRQDPKSLDAWDCIQRGWWHIDQVSREDNAKAKALFQRAIEIDPHFSNAHSALATSYLYEVLSQWTDNPLQSITQALQSAEKSVALSSEDPSGHTVLGMACTVAGQFERGVAEQERAVELNPSSARNYWGLGQALANSGRPQEAIAMLEKAIRLSPNDPRLQVFLFHLAFAHFLLGRYKETIELGKKSLKLRPDQSYVHRILAACYGHLGQAEEGEAALKEAFRIFPGFSIEKSRLVNPPAFIDRLVAGWRQCGWKG
ncbi:MAG: tetratricopeptide repeat protein, partial [Vicinamibacteria bacterium]